MKRSGRDPLRRARAFLGLIFLAWIALGSAACSRVEEEEAESGEDELRQPRAGDAVVRLLTTPLAAAPAPKAFAGVTSWSADLVDMTDDFHGVLLYGRDAKGEALYLMPVVAFEIGTALLVFRVVQGQEEAELVDLEALLSSQDPEQRRDAGEAVAWLRAERVRVGRAIKTSLARGEYDASDATTGLQIQTGKLAMTALAVRCGAEMGANILLFTNPVAAMLVQAGVDGVGAVVSYATGDQVEAVVDGAMAGTDLAAAAAFKYAQRIPAIFKRMFPKLVLVITGIAVLIETKDKGLVEGAKSVGQFLLDIAVPESCVKLAGEMAKD
jgi:hypothetical protein